MWWNEHQPTQYFKVSNRFDIRYPSNHFISHLRYRTIPTLEFHSINARMSHRMRQIRNSVPFNPPKKTIPISGQFGKSRLEKFSAFVHYFLLSFISIKKKHRAPKQQICHPDYLSKPIEKLFCATFSTTKFFLKKEKTFKC